MIRSAIRICVLVVLSAAVGVGYARYRQLPLIPNVQKIEEQTVKRVGWLEETQISLDEFVQHYEMGGLVLDARPRELFEEGHLDAPLIMNVPADEAADGYQIDRVMPYRGQRIVIYCSSETCDSAEMLWNALRAWGFAYEVRVFHAGWTGIEAAGLPATAGPDLFQDEPDAP